MFIIWGIGSRQKVLKFLVSAVCGNCGKHTNMNIVKTYKCGTIFLIPIIKVQTKYFIVCPHCGAAKQITKKEFLEIQNAYNNGVQYSLEKQEFLRANSNCQAAQNCNQTENKLIETKNEEQTTQTNQLSITTQVVAEINKIMEQMKQKGYILTPEKKDKLKNAIKQNLNKKFDNELVVNLTVDRYFEKII